MSDGSEHGQSWATGTVSDAGDRGPRGAGLRADLAGMSPTRIWEVAHRATRWMEEAAGSEDWPAAADAGELAALAAAHLFRAVALDERSEVVAAFRSVAPDAATLLLRAGRTADALVVLEVAGQQVIRFRSHAIDLERRLRVGANPGHRRASDQPPATPLAPISRAPIPPAPAPAAPVATPPGPAPLLAEIRTAAEPHPLCYLWSSRYGTGVVLVLADGSMRSRSLPALTDSVLTRAFTGPAPQPSRGLGDAELARIDQHVGPALAEALQGVWDEGVSTAVDATALDTVRPDSVRPDSVRPDSVRPVTVVVSGPVSAVPLHAWAARGDDRGVPAPRPPLIYTPSARQATASRRPPPATSSRRLLSLADPQPLPAGVASRRSARLEATLIAETAAGSDLRHGRDATVAALLDLAPRHDVVHLACPVVADPLYDGGFRIELAGGAMSAQDVVDQLDLDATLVVLSSCTAGSSTGGTTVGSVLAGGSDPGDVFLAAGARAVVANRWPVDDLAATLWVTWLFELWDWGAALPLPAAVQASHRRLRAVTLAELQALARREPRLAGAVRRSNPVSASPYSDPYLWAPFACSGG